MTIDMGDNRTDWRQVDVIVCVDLGPVSRTERALALQPGIEHGLNDLIGRGASVGPRRVCWAEASSWQGSARLLFGLSRVADWSWLNPGQPPSLAFNSATRTIKARIRCAYVSVCACWARTRTIRREREVDEGSARGSVSSGYNKPDPEILQFLALGVFDSLESCFRH